MEKAVDIKYFDPLFVHFGPVSSVGEFSKSELIVRQSKTGFSGSKASQPETHVCIYQLFNHDDFFEFPGEETVLFELTNLKTDFWTYG